MNIEEISIEDALDIQNLKDSGLKFALIYSLNKVKLCTLESAEVNRETLIEAIFFTDSKAVHVFRNEYGLRAVRQVDNGNEDCFIETQILMDSFGKEISIKNYIGYDKEDNQAHIVYSRPCHAILGGEK